MHSDKRTILFCGDLIIKNRPIIDADEEMVKGVAIVDSTAVQWPMHDCDVTIGGNPSIAAISSSQRSL